MSSGAEPNPSRAIKLLLTGDSGVGKTGAIVSLILAGYKVRTIDVDNKIDIILHCLHEPKSPYYAAAQRLNLNEAFRYETVNHKMITMDTGKQVRIQPASATVWPKIEKLCHEWREPGGVFLGPISSWGTDTVLVVDSFTFAGFAALYYVQELNGHLGGESSGNTWRRDIGGAQDHLDTVLKLLCSDSTKCHIIVITHINYLSESYNEDKQTGKRTLAISSNASDIFGVARAYPSAIGRALGPRIGAYFNNVLEMKTEGMGSNARRRIYTIPTGTVNVKTSAPFALREHYDISTGLAEIFTTLRASGAKPKPKQQQESGDAKPTSTTVVAQPSAVAQSAA